MMSEQQFKLQPTMLVMALFAMIVLPRFAPTYADFTADNCPPVDSIVVDPENEIVGTNLSNPFTCVTLRAVGKGSPDVCVGFPNFDATGNVFIAGCGGSSFWDAPSFLRADFWPPATVVSFAFSGRATIGNGDVGVLRAFDSAGGLLAEQFTAPLMRPNCQTLSISGVGNIGYVTASGGYLQWLSFEQEPARPVVYVKASALGANDGSSWADAYTDLQDALADPGDQIWVAAGTYTPAGAVGSRQSTFQLVNCVAMYGGFAGIEDPATFDLADRDISTNETILSGDLNGNDVPAEFPAGVSFDDNSLHVVTGTRAGAGTILDGFTIRAGNANGSGLPELRGGGMYNDHPSSPIIRSCTFAGNYAVLGGGGMLNISGGSPTVVGCSFVGNATGGSGGGMYNFSGDASPTVVDCTFSGNSARDGGGMANFKYHPNVSGCTFSQNSAQNRGGAMSNIVSTLTISDCHFLNNAAFSFGGGIEHAGDNNLTLSNCTFVENASTVSGGGAVSVVTFGVFTPIVVTECQFVGNSASSGGAIIFAFKELLLQSCTFTGNSAVNLGGAIRDISNNLPGAQLTMIGCALNGNTAGAGGAAAIGPTSGGSTTINNCSFNGNSAVGNGGALLHGSSTLTVTGCTFSGNAAGGPDRNSAEGGAVDGGGDMTFADCTFVGNSVTASFGEGGGISADAGTLSMTNCALCGNSAIGSRSLGGGIHLGQAAAATLTNCTVAGNSAVDGAGIGLQFNAVGTLTNSIVWGNDGNSQIHDPSALLTVSFSDVQGGWPGTNNIDADPLFADAANCDLRPQDGSPVTDAADPAAPGLPATDLDGNDRIIGQAPDMGAFELAIVNEPPVAEAGPDQTVNEGDSVTLDASVSSDPNGDPLTYDWTKVAGPTVTLSLSDTVNPTFTAPTVPVGGATVTLQLVVSDGLLFSEPDTVNVTVKNVNHAPQAHAGDDQTVAEGALVTLDGSDSFDDDGDSFTFAWIQTAGPAVTLSDSAAAEPTFVAPFVGSLGAAITFELTVDDGIDISSDSVSITVDNVNHDPVADAGPDQTRDEETPVTLDGNASSDPDSDALTYAWTQLSGPSVALSSATSPTPTFTAPSVGAGGATLLFQLEVDDGFGGVNADQVVITVLDGNAPPACDLARPSKAQLWPPNHKMVAVSIIGVTDPENAELTITITAVTQDEPLNGLGDGDTAPDAVIQGSTVLLRAERAGGGNGRVYHISFTAVDGAGGQCSGQVTVCVPHDRRKGTTCVDDGRLYDSLGP